MTTEVVSVKPGDVVVAYFPSAKNGEYVKQLRSHLEQALGGKVNVLCLPDECRIAVMRKENHEPS